MVGFATVQRVPRTMRWCSLDIGVIPKGLANLELDHVIRARLNDQHLGTDKNAQREVTLAAGRIGVDVIDRRSIPTCG